MHTKVTELLASCHLASYSSYIDHQNKVDISPTKICKIIIYRDVCCVLTINILNIYIAIANSQIYHRNEQFRLPTPQQLSGESVYKSSDENYSHLMAYSQ